MKETSKRVRELYTDMYADGVERAWRDVGAVDKAGNIAAIWRRAGLSDRPRVVEIGCGEGAVAEALAKGAFYESYAGYDLSESGIREARARGIEDAVFEQVDSDRMPIEDDGADVAILSHVVEHLEYPRALIYDAARIAPLVLVEVPLELNARLPRDFVWDDLGHINKYTSTSIRQLVQTCNLNVIEQMTTNPSLDVAIFGRDTRRRRLEWRIKESSLMVLPILARSFFTYHETLLARRDLTAERGSGFLR